MNLKINKKNLEKSLKKGSILINKGELVIFPTETVYGIGADATNPKALNKIYKVKRRPRNNPLICHFYNFKKIQNEFIVNLLCKKLAKKFWPGPLTLILEKKSDSKINGILSNNDKFVGCRIPSNKIARKLLKSINVPIAAPSANISTKLSATNTYSIDKRLKNKVHIIDGGSSKLGLESTVVDLTKKHPKILRFGSITVEEIKEIIPEIKFEKSKSFLSPGTLAKHYSPEKKIRINIKKVLKNEVLLNFGKNNLYSKIFQLNLSLNGNLKEASKNFYYFMHRLDKIDNISIAIAPIPNIGLGKTINDRLKRAISKN